MNRLSNSRAARWIFAVLLTAVIVPALFAQDAPPPPDQEKEKEERYQKEAMEVIARYIEAIGGEEALRKHKHRTLEGEISMPAMNLSGPLRMYAVAPNRFLLVAQLPGTGELRQGFDGEVAWSIDAMQGPMIIEGPQAKDIRRQADFYGELNYRKNYKTIESAGTEPFHGIEAHKLRLVDQIDKESFAYFNAENDLYIGARAEMQTHMGVVPTTTLVSNYREFDGVKVPMQISLRIMNMEQRMKFESVSHDEIADEVFELPDAIKALLPQDEEEEEDKSTSQRSTGQ